MKKYKRVIAMALSAALLIATTGCAEGALDQSVSFDWVESDLFESIDETANVSLKDDFAAAVNHDWTTQQVRDFNYSVGSIGEACKRVNDNKRALLEDETVTGDNIEILRAADGLYCDLDYRDSLGVEPLKKYLGYIDDINTLEDISSYMLDNEKNPFAVSLVDLKYGNNDTLDNSFSLIITKPELLLENLEDYVSISEDGFKEKEIIEKEAEYLFSRCGYSSEDIDTLIDKGFWFESELAQLDYTDYPDYTNVIKMSEVIEKAGEYPLEEMLNHYGIADCDDLTGEMSYLDELESIYIEENVDEMKAFFKLRLAIKSLRFLDQDSYEQYKEIELDRTNPYEERIDHDIDQIFFDIIYDTPLGAAMDQVYIDNYYDEEVCDEVASYIEDIKEKYMQMIEANESLSEDSKAAVIEKMEKMDEMIAIPSNKADLSNVEIKTKEEGGSFLDAMCSLSRAKYEHIADMLQVKYENKAYWDIYDGDISTTRVNAFYMIAKNAFYIDIGILTEPFFSRDASVEEKFAYLVTIIGHEISHAFDSNGIYYDADGKFSEKVSDDDLKNWGDAEERILLHLSSFEPFEGSGSYGLMSPITGEVIADIEGVRVTLSLAKEYNDFDYDRFFKAYAEHWRRMESKTQVMERIKTDPHPLTYLRTNYTLMQFDEFYETYDIGPGDGMYLAPEQRIVIW